LAFVISQTECGRRWRRSNKCKYSGRLRYALQR